MYAFFIGFITTYTHANNFITCAQNIHKKEFDHVCTE